MSGLFGSTVIKGNRLTDFSNTTASVGTPIPFGYGRFVTSGNVIWAPLPPKERVAKKRQGKGGVKQEVYTYTLCYALAACKGPIYGFWWIRRNGKVVWTQDPAAPVEDKAYAAKWAQKATFYYGVRSQLPDSTIESYEGSGQVSAFRDIAYIVIEDDDVTDGGGAVPNYEFCVIADGVSYSTSRPYPVEVTDSLGVGASAGGNEWRVLRKDAGLVDPAVLSARMGSVEYRVVRKDARMPVDTALLSARVGTGTHRVVLKNAYAPTDPLKLGARVGVGYHKRVRFDARVPHDTMKLGARIGTGVKS